MIQQTFSGRIRTDDNTPMLLIQAYSKEASEVIVFQASSFVEAEAIITEVAGTNGAFSVLRLYKKR